jgi:hypothetical protein
VLTTQFLYALPFARCWRRSCARCLSSPPAPARLAARGAARGDDGEPVSAPGLGTPRGAAAALVQLLLLSATSAPRSRERPLESALAVGLAGALLLGSLWTALSLRNISGDPQLGPRVPLRPVSYANRTPGLQRVMEFLLPRVVPGEPMFVPRQEPLLYFATHTRNPTPFPSVLPGLREPRNQSSCRARRRPLRR